MLDSITITANGEATIVLHKDGKININGRSISINASESIEMRAEDKFILSAKADVNISCDKEARTSLTSDGGIEELNGTKIRVN